MRPLGVIGPLTRDVVAGAPRVGGGPWHAARALGMLRRDAVVVGKCAERDRRELHGRLASLGLPTFVAGGGAQTTAFSFSYADDGTRRMRVDAVGEPWTTADLPEVALRRVEWLHVAPLLRGDFDAALLERLARGRRLLLDGQGLVRVRAVGPLRLDAHFDRALLRSVTVLKLAEEEAAVVGDLASLGVPEVLVTAGSRGARVVTPDADVHVPARPLDVDPTGAGDAFGVAYLASRAEGHSPLSAARRATALVAALLGGR